ncbi:MAG: hypothetical protein KDA74_08700 [Planctomycetaceae bacterium]|nr:hypothetical protein [Planctomycetaceae bacterium]
MHPSPVLFREELVVIVPEIIVVLPMKPGGTMQLNQSCSKQHKKCTNDYAWDRICHYYCVLE